MTPNQLIYALAKLGYNQSSFARQFDYDARTMGRWAAGKSPVPKLASALLKLMLKTGTKPEDLEP